MRKPRRIQWPGGARIAVSIVLNVEEWTAEGPSRFYMPFPPGAKATRDSATVTDQEYGWRAGLWRLLEILDRHGVKTTAWTSGLAAERRPDAIREMHDAGHEIGGHGYDQSVRFVVLDREEEAAAIRMSVERIREVTAEAPIGWMSPGARSGVHTLELLLESGFIYHSDTVGGDLPYLESVGSRRLLAVPYTLLNNDYRFYLYGDPPLTPAETLDWLRADFDQLYDEGENFPQMMTYGVHPYVTGRPGRARAFEDFIRYVKGFPGVWFARRDEIARCWLKQNEE
ncbi:MAG: polysaccharide deacetylase family protein [Nitrospinota bacterium]|nr:polysaccharide deacetylase family protein [Nitrospinota bacterium]